MSKDYTVHPAAAVFPMMSDAELDALAADIKANGLRIPVQLVGNEIVDGRNRLEACKRIGRTPIYAEVSPKPDDIVAYVTSMNIERRHLTTAQRGAIAAELATLTVGRPAKEKERNQPIPPKPPTIDEAAKLMKVSRDTVVRSKKRMVEKPEEHERVKRGEKVKPAPKPKKPAIVISKTTQRMDEPAVAHDITDMLDKSLDRGGLLSPKVQGQLIQLTKRAAYLSNKDRRALIASLRRVSAVCEKHAAAHEKILATK